MTLTPKQQEELASLGPDNVRLKLGYAGYGRGAAVGGFTSGDMDRGDVEDWLAEETRKAAKLQADTLWWAKVSAALVVLGIVVTIVLALAGH